MARFSSRLRKGTPAAGPGGLATEDARTDSALTLFPAAVIVAAAIWVYWPALAGSWIWDDILLVAANPNLRGVGGLWNIWFAPPTSDYWPLTWTLLWVEWQVWGSEPIGYHLCNLALHISSGLLVWRIFSRLGIGGAWLGGLLFVVHPLAIESVAWISEIKNALSLPLYLLAVNAWLDHEEGKPFAYSKSVLYYLAAMLAKTSTVMLPFVLLLYCWWKRGRVTARDVRSMIPFVAIAVLLGLITVFFQHSAHQFRAVPIGGFGTRFIRAGVEVFFYLGKIILPADLLPIYPQWTLDPPSLLQILAMPALAALLIALWTQRKGWGRHALFGVGFFLLNVLPVLGFVEMKYMGISWVADHFVYLPMIGLIGLFVAGYGQISDRVSATLRPLSTGALTAILVLYAWKAHWYASAFTSAETLWTYEIDRQPDAWFAHNELGKIMLRDRDYEDATDEFTTVVRLQPKVAEPYNNLGMSLSGLERFPEALAAFHAALALDPKYPGAHNNFGILLAKTGHTDQAIEQFRAALDGHANNIDAHLNLGLALEVAGRTPEAVEQFQQALAIDPNNVIAQRALSRLRGAK